MPGTGWPPRSAGGLAVTSEPLVKAEPGLESAGELERD